MASIDLPSSKCRVTMVGSISKVPDEVLCHILSFLPTEDAAATSVLSKKWKPLWLLVPSMDFHDRRYLEGKKKKSYSSFINFVYAAILSRGLHQPVENFKLICDEGDVPFSDMKVWLTAAIQRGVKTLEMELSPSHVPCCILSCKTLVALKLSFAVFDDGAFSSVDLPSLKTLYLNGVEFLKPQVFLELLYQCPVLENLELHDVSYDDYSFDGEVKSLPRLVRAEVFSDGDSCIIPVKALSNVKFLRLEECDADIDNIPVFPNLVYMELLIGGSIKWSLALDMLNHCPKLQTAVFNLSFDDDDEDVWPYPQFVPECFLWHLRKCFLKDFTGLDCQMRFARYVLQNSASLCTMTIGGLSHSYANYQKKLEMMTELASCPRSSATCEVIFE